MCNNKGITIIALVITIVVMLILAGVGLYFGKDAVDRAELEDIKTNMISIKTKAKIVAEQYNFKDINSLVGKKYTEDNTYNKSNINHVFSSFTNEQKANLYIWTNDDLKSQGLSLIDVNTQDFYIIYYDLNDTNKCEIYYSNGYEGKYSLNELKDI